MPYLPVYLRNIIIDPTIARPKQYICIQIVIVLQAVGLASERIVLFVTVDTKRTNTELHPRLQATNSLVYLLNQYINIAPAPVGTIGEPSAVTGKVRKVKKVWTEDGYMLFWTAPKAKDEMDRAVQYVVYRFDDKEKVNIDDASHIVAVTRNNFYKLPYKDGKNKYRYVVTALDRLHNESKSVSKKVKL